MKVVVRAAGGILSRASSQLLSNNIEAYENTIPSMLSDRLRNPKFSGPENRQTGIAAEWEPAGNTMMGFSCRLVPGMYLSGREAQLIHNYAQRSWCGILQAGEEFEAEMWARAQHRPVKVGVELRLAGHGSPESSKAEMATASRWPRAWSESRTTWLTRRPISSARRSPSATRG